MEEGGQFRFFFFSLLDLLLQQQQPRKNQTLSQQAGRAIPWNPLELYRGYAVRKRKRGIGELGRAFSLAGNEKKTPVSAHLSPSVSHLLLPFSLPFSLQVNATSFAPICAIQFGANRVYEQALTSAGVAPGGVAGTLLAAGAAGATSTVVGNPCELLMIRQQQHRSSLVAEARAVVGDHGVRGLYRGLVSFFFWGV